MNGYRFQLQKYQPGSKTVCPRCGRKGCFTKYVDTEEQIVFPSNVGLCDHINSCGYHYTPKEYFSDNPVAKEQLADREQGVCKSVVAKRSDTKAVVSVSENDSCKAQPSFLPSEWVEQSMRRYDMNPLYSFFVSVAGKERTEQLFSLYKVGTSKMWGGAAVFWQIDYDGNVRAGKIMGYDARTGHRIKEPYNQVSWVHSVREMQDFRMRQCLFGEHLLSGTSAGQAAKPVAIVESEKTALVAALFITDYIWLATGGMYGCFNADAMQVLQGREVVLFPDLKATEEWGRKAQILQGICKRVTCSNLLEKMASDEQREAGLDIADFLLMEETPQSILAKMIERNPELQRLIDDLDLVLVE